MPRLRSNRLAWLLLAAACAAPLPARAAAGVVAGSAASTLGTAAGERAAGAAAAAEIPATARLESLRTRGDVAGQRTYAGQVFARIAADLTRERSVLRGWHDQSDLFDGAAASAAGTAATHQSVGAPLLILTHYNAAAARHIRTHRLAERAALDRLRVAGARDARIPALRSVPEFPYQAIVVKTCWWPVAARGPTAMPYWDPRREAPRRGGHPYTSWRSVVAIEPPPANAASAAASRADVQFAGQRHPAARRVALEAFHHLRVDAAFAQRLMADAESRRAAVVALGRPLAAGDYLVLVAAHIATRELPEWIWITLWWDGVVRAPGREAADVAVPTRLGHASAPPQLRAAPWRDYSLDATFDAEIPRASDGGARIAFNPWLEARMPDDGAGDGTRSNCLACHRRATYPGTRFLPVTRGAPDLERDPAFAAGKLHTGFLWSIANRAR